MKIDDTLGAQPGPMMLGLIFYVWAAMQACLALVALGAPAWGLMP